MGHRIYIFFEYLGVKCRNRRPILLPVTFDTYFQLLQISNLKKNNNRSIVSKKQLLIKTNDICNSSSCTTFFVSYSPAISQTKPTKIANVMCSDHVQKLSPTHIWKNMWHFEKYALYGKHKLKIWLYIG